MANTTFQGADIVSPRETLFEQVRFAGYPRGPTSAADLRLSANFRPCSHRETVSRDDGRHGIALRPLFAQGDRTARLRCAAPHPSTPVRAGRPSSHRARGEKPPFDPCSHRETDKSEGRHPPPRLRPLFAQGGRHPSDPSEPAVSSTPVRTGRPALSLVAGLPSSFDPCSHRETRWALRWMLWRYLRPLFAQGDHDGVGWSWRMNTSTPVRTGRPSLRLRRDRRVTFDPCSHRETTKAQCRWITETLRPLFAQGDRPTASRRTKPITFDPCSHRETIVVVSHLEHGTLRPLFAQGDPDQGSDARRSTPSTPVRTGRPGATQFVTPRKGFDPCSHRETSFSRSRGACSTLRPLFAQGGLRIRVGHEHDPPSIHACRGLPSKSSGCSNTDFQPCGHRANSFPSVRKTCKSLPALRSQGNRQAGSTGMSFFTSSPAFTGQPLRLNVLNYKRCTNCTPSKVTTDRKRLTPRFLIRTPPAGPVLCTITAPSH